MGSKYKSLSILDFQRLFPDHDACLLQLSKMKWRDGFRCGTCGLDQYCLGDRPHDRQCTSCSETGSPTAKTLFQKVKFPIHKAFWMDCYLASNQKGISSTELGRKLELRQKTSWGFKRNVMVAMKPSGKHPLYGVVEVDEAFVGGQESARGRGNKKKRLVVFAMERKGQGVSRLYGAPSPKQLGRAGDKVIPSAHAKHLGEFIGTIVAKTAKIRTDGCTGYAPLKRTFMGLKQERSGPKGGNFKEMPRMITGFKSWLRGIHHRAQHLQAYVNEYSSRFNRSSIHESVFQNLLDKMVASEPHPFKTIVRG